MSNEFQDGYWILRWQPEFYMATGIKNGYPYLRWLPDSYWISRQLQNPIKTTEFKTTATKYQDGHLIPKRLPESKTATGIKNCYQSPRGLLDLLVYGYMNLLVYKLKEMTSNKFCIGKEDDEILCLVVCKENVEKMTPKVLKQNALLPSLKLPSL